MQSESIGELAKALCKVQGEIKEPLKSSNNPFFKSKYADLASVRACGRDLLAENGLSIVQTIGAPGEGECDHLGTTLLHTSGEWIRSVASIRPLETETKKGSGVFTVTPQTYGAAVTYLRRCTLAAMLGVSGEEDDDGNSSYQKGSTNKEVAGKKHTGGGVKGMSEAINPPSPGRIMDSLLHILKKHGGKTKAERLTFLRSLIVAHTIGVDPEKITNPSQLKGLDVSNVISGFTASLANELFKK